MFTLVPTASSDFREEKFRQLVAAMRNVNNYKPQLAAPDWHAFNYNASNLRNMRLFVTSARNIGIGPNTTETGDQICILYGGPVPYVVCAIQGDKGWRPGLAGGKENWFLGGCYLHNMMDGQAMEAKNGVYCTEKTFVFR